MTRAISGITASACPRVIGSVSEARIPPRWVSRTAAEQASSAVSMARMRMSNQPADEEGRTTNRTTINRTSPAVRSHRPYLDHVGHVVLQQILDAVPQRRRRRWAAGAGALHVEEHDAVFEAAERDVAAVVLDRRPHPGLDQLLDGGDGLGVLGFEELVPARRRGAGLTADERRAGYEVLHDGAEDRRLELLPLAA